MTTNNYKFYPLKNSHYQIHFQTVPGSEFLKIWLKDGDNDSFCIGSYSVEQKIWSNRDETIILPDEVLKEILAYATGYAFSRKERLSSADIFTK